MSGPLVINASLNVTGNLKSAKYELGSDLILYPIVNNQTAIKSWWGLQLRGNTQNNLVNNPIAIASNNSYSVVAITDSSYLPTAASFAIVGGNGQTMPLQVWQNVGLNTVANISPTGAANFSSDVSIGGSLRITNDSSLGNNLPYAQIDVSNGKKIVTAGNYYGQEYRSIFHTTTTTTTVRTPIYSSDVSINNVNFPTGNYKITASYAMNKTITSSDLLSRIQVDGVTLGGIHNHELSDTTTWLYTTRILYTTLTVGTHTIDLQFSQESAGTLSKRDVYLEIIRVS